MKSALNGQKASGLGDEPNLCKSSKAGYCQASNNQKKKLKINKKNPTPNVSLARNDDTSAVNEGQACFPSQGAGHRAV